MIIWRMCIAYYITKATNKHSEYVVLIAIPQEHWLHERTAMLHYTYIAPLMQLHTHIEQSFFVYLLYSLSTTLYI